MAPRAIRSSPLDGSVDRRLRRRVAGARPAADPAARACPSSTPRCTVSGAAAGGALEPAGLTRWSSSRSRPSPTAPSRRCRSRTRRSPARSTSPLRAGPEPGAESVIANDPDADRLGVAVPDSATGLASARGDEIGVLLADHLLARPTGDDRLVVTTLVSSSMLSRGRGTASHSPRRSPASSGSSAPRSTSPGGVSCSATRRRSATSWPDGPRDKDGISAAVAASPRSRPSCRRGHDDAGVARRHRARARRAPCRSPTCGACVASPGGRAAVVRRRAARPSGDIGGT